MVQGHALIVEEVDIILQVGKEVQAWLGYQENDLGEEGIRPIKKK